MRKQYLHAASRQWATRPDDERWLNLTDLHRYTWERANRCEELPLRAADLLPRPTESGDLVLDVEGQSMTMTNWSSQQLAAAAGIPHPYLASLPPKLAVANLMYGLRSADSSHNVFIDTEINQIRAVTSSTYGRIYDHQVAEAMVRLEDRGWKIPSASYEGTNPLRATTLYAGDRDVFLFLVDPSRPIILPGQDKPSYRGAIAWNSEVGSCRFDLLTFLYEYVCDNRIIWGASNVETMEIIHSKSAQDRFLNVEAKLVEYMGQSDSIEIGKIQAAQNKQLADFAGDEVQDQIAWVNLRTKIPVATVHNAWTLAAEEDQPTETVWDAVQALTAHSRSIPNQSQRTALERRAAALLN